MADDDETVARGKRETILGIGEQEFMLWTHNPITAGYLQYLEDLIALYRASAADFLENGQFDTASPHQDTNPNVLRGQIVMLRQLHGISLATIQGFYGKEPEPSDDQEAQA